MKCPACIDNGVKSTISLASGSFSTSMASYPWYDEEGAYHDHDPNWRTQGWRCSAGHEGSVSVLPKCPQGDHGEGPNVTVSRETR